jgi:hypothetical protein
MAERVLLGFSFCGDHQKAHVGPVNPLLHWKMLLTAMRMVNPRGEYPMLVSAVALSDEESVQEVRRKATVISTANNPGHQAGAAEAMYAAIEWAASQQFDYLVYLAEDILFWIRDPVERMVEALRSSGACYLGSPWITLDEISTVVLCCRPAVLCRDGVCVFRDSQPHTGHLEEHVLRRLQALRLPYLHSGPHSLEYCHEHRPRQFLKLAAEFQYPDPEAEERLRRYVSGKRFLYRRVGHDERVMEFMEDGRIGVGGTEGERKWRVDPRQGKVYLTIHGHIGSICQLALHEDGVLRGRWLRFEQMPIELIPDPDNAPRTTAADRLRNRYERCCTAGADISQHLPLLYQLACQVEYVTEIGVGAGNSTTAFLLAQPKRFVTYDVRRLPVIRELEALKGKTQFEFRVENSLTAEIEPTDLLFIDSYHSYEQLSAELKRHAQHARRYIVLHDTDTFGYEGEGGGKGLRMAMSEFLTDHPEWQIVYDVRFNNGLTVLERAATRF